MVHRGVAIGDELGRGTTGYGQSGTDRRQRDRGTGHDRCRDRSDAAALEMPDVPKVPEMPDMPEVPGFQRILRFLGQVDPLDGGTLYRGRPTRRPQRGQQERRFAQMRPAAFLPARAVRA